MNETLRTLFRQDLPDQNIQSIDQISETRAHAVWKVTTSTSVFAVKRHIFAPLTQSKPYDLLTVEQKVTNHLLSRNVSVPKIIATDPTQGLRIYEWCGDHTLDDICQSTDPAPFSTPVISTLVTLEEAFHDQASTFDMHIAPGCNKEELQDQWESATQPLIETLPHLVHHLTEQTVLPDLLSAFKTLLDDLANAPPTLGPTDYNARNIVCADPNTASILDLTKIGYDWPERRLVQYTTSLGAHNPNGQVIGLLTSKSTQQYAQQTSKIYQKPSQDILTRLDAHHFIFHLLALQMCLAVSQTPDHPWQNLENRFVQHIEQLAQPFSDHTGLGELRSFFQST